MYSRTIRRQRKSLYRLWSRNRRDGFRIIRSRERSGGGFSYPLQEGILSCGEPAAEWGAMTIEEAIERFIRYKSLTLKDTSLDRLEQVARCNIIPRIGKYPCDAFDDTAYYDELIIPLVKQGLSYSSLKKVQDLMFPFCRWCVVPSRQYMRHDPLAGLDKLTEVSVHNLRVRYGVESTDGLEGGEEDQPKVAVLDAEQRERFVAACRAAYSSGRPRFPHGEAFVFMLYTGLRIGEMSALRWSDVDFEKRLIRVRGNLTGVKCRDSASPQYGRRVSRINPFTKTNRPRTIPLGRMAYESIQRLYEARRPDSQLVLVNRDGNLIDPVTLQMSLRRIYQFAGIELPPGVNAHALRHTFASMCFENGLSVKQVSELLGHKSTQLTIDTYIHLIGDVNLKSMPELTDLK